MIRVVESLDYSQKEWNQFFSEKGESWRDKDYRFLAQVFELSNFFGTLLDVGCGLGDGEIFLKENCNNISEIYACDFSSQAIETCRNNKKISNTHFFVHDLMTQKFSQTFDCVICLQTLEHLPNPNKAFKTIYEAAEKLLIVSTPYKNRRPDKNHLWSFDENDFNEYNGQWIIAQEGLNIFWLFDKSGTGATFKQNKNINSNFKKLVLDFKYFLKKTMR
ncbi:class I SAM-dependent methyltransferase [Desulfuromonas sp. KJ2020]|uniref:class I SAM-dependent methyltransferase n=1 Tax=Desulfuromonas sp. KJ2020 TaxID=2919173 RepID=UPI0020A70E2F|nr:class I SAM-dependent methyltransferase [Desulfuromonas sp. KJ2020]MCP3177499.1 class I SAM-dependent methyltransferase [Desulfuromonas sp. KJ2020]